MAKTLYQYHRPADKGFALLELVAVLVIAAIAAVVVTSALSRNKTNLLGRAEALKSHIRYAQAMAMSTDEKNWGIRFHVPGNRYWLFYCDTGQACNFNDNRVPIPGTEPDQQNRIRLDDGGVGIAGISHGGNRVTLAFDNFGTPYWGDQNDVLENLLTASFDITLRNSTGNQAVVRVTPTTGFVP